MKSNRGRGACPCTAAGLWLVVLAFFLGTSSAMGAEVTLTPAKDNTLHDNPRGAVSNGSGERMFVGVAGGVSTRRAVLAFDVASSVPAGSTIAAVTLTMNMSKTIAGEFPAALHRLLDDWGEGASDAAGQEGAGARSEPGDATWIHTFYDTGFWSTEGGDFERLPSAVIPVGDIGYYTWGSTPGMVADVQGWLDDPSGNFGWIVIGDESPQVTVKRFDTKDGPAPEVWPMLTIEFEAPVEPPDCATVCQALFECEGASTTVVLEGSGSSSAGEVLLEWDGPCEIADPASGLTTADCPGTGGFDFTLTVTTDEDGNGVADVDEPSSSCALLVTVQDTTAPEPALPDDRAVECAVDGGAFVEVAAAAEDLCGAVSFLNSRTGASHDASGDYALGRSTVAWSVSDEAGNESCGWNDVDVVDTTPPVVVCSAAAEAAPPGSGGAGSGDDEGVDEDEDGDDSGGTGEPGFALALAFGSADACCDGGAAALIDIGCAEVAVEDGQLIELHCGSTAGCMVLENETGVLELHGEGAILVVSSIDCAGNAGSCVLDLCDSGGGSGAGRAPLGGKTGAGDQAGAVKLQGNDGRHESSPGNARRESRRSGRASGSPSRNSGAR